MPRNRKAAHSAGLSRYVKITRWNPSLSVHAEKQRGGVSMRRTLHCLEFEGILEEPVKGVSKLSGTIFPADEAPILHVPNPSVGSIISIHEAVTAVVTLTHQEFSWMLSLIAGSQIGACYLGFNTPVRGKALIQSFSFFKDIPSVDER